MFLPLSDRWPQLLVDLLGRGTAMLAKREVEMTSFRGAVPQNLS
jgi:hypothetical protein